LREALIPQKLASGVLGRSELFVYLFFRILIAEHIIFGGILK
jgi:hypothetical protein